MLIQDCSTLTRPAALTIRPGDPRDRQQVRHLLLSAYGQYQHDLSPAAWSRYLTDLIDFDRHTRLGRLLVAELDGHVVGSAVFYPDSSVQGFGWPSGWAGGRGLAVHPSARGRGVARALLAECERLARDHNASVFAFHTAHFMTSAVALYERLGYRRIPEFDLDLNGYLGEDDAAPVLALAYRRDLAGVAA